MLADKTKILMGGVREEMEGGFGEGEEGRREVLERGKGRE